MESALPFPRAGRGFVLALAAAVLLSASASLAEEAPPKLGPDFQVNTFTLGDQDHPDVARHADGSFVVVWQDFTNSRLKARVYEASGAPAGGEVEVSGAGPFETPPKVAALPDRGFAVAWVDQHDVLLRRFDREGQPLADAVAVNDSNPEPNKSPDIAADSRGNLAVVWYRDGFFDDLVLLRRFDAAGNPQGDPLQVNSLTTRRPSAPRVAVNDSGSCLVSWQEGVGFKVLARRLDGASGAWAKEVSLGASFGGRLFGSAPVLHAAGDGAVVFGTLGAPGESLFAQRLDAAGKLLGEASRVGEGFAAWSELDGPDAAVDGAGNTFVVWTHFRSPEGPRIFGRLFDRSFEPRGEAFAVSADPLHLNAEDLLPAVAADGVGGFVTVWSNGRIPEFLFPIPLPPQILDGRDGSQFGVFGQLLGDPACTVESETLCLGPGNRFRVKVSWRLSSGETGSGHARRLTADTGALWFFGPDNLEVMIKAIDGRAVNGHFWIFFGSLSNVEYTITVTDTATGQEKTYHNPAGTFASRADVEAFAEAEPGSTASPGPAAAAVLHPQLSPPLFCPASPEDLCFGDGRFHVTVTFVDPRTGASGRGKTLPLTGDTGAVWFFDPENLEVMIKVLDGGAVNGHFWVFYGALSNVRYTITVTDTATGAQRTYANPRGRLASAADVEAFPR